MYNILHSINVTIDDTDTAISVHSPDRHVRHMWNFLKKYADHVIAKYVEIGRDCTFA